MDSRKIGIFALTIVIPYKSEVHNGLELKFALRSIEKNLTGWDRVVIVSENPPDWLRGVHFIYFGEQGQKEHSVYTKLLHCCYVDDISENFIYWNDDHFLLKPLHVSEIKYWHNGPLEARVGHVYNRELTKTQNTIKCFESFSCIIGITLVEGLLNYDIHTPIIINKKAFQQLFKNLTEEYCIKSLYANFVYGDIFQSERNEFMEDCKILGAMSKAIIGEKIKGRLFFSTNAICSPTVQVLEERFPKKSKFEL